MSGLNTSLSFLPFIASRGIFDNFGCSRHPGSSGPHLSQDEKKKLRAKRKTQRIAKKKGR